LAGFILLSSAQMRAAEAASAISSAALMEAAGAQVAAIAMRAWTKRPVAVICGPGNNGGDGFVAARILKDAGWEVTVGLLGERTALPADAKLMADLYDGSINPAHPSLLTGAGLIVDALFGTGISRPVDGAARTIIEAVNANPAPVLSIDMPSGINADSGAMMGVAVRAVRSITFFHKKPGHVLFPGRACAGVVEVVDIGIEPQALSDVRLDTMENHPGFWGPHFRRPTFQTHKYHRGHAFVVSGGALNTGAARLAAISALRIGAGVVTVLSPKAAALVHAAHLTAIMLQEADSGEDISKALAGKDKYQQSVVVGPGCGVASQTREKTLSILKTSASAVVDADALTSFEAKPADLFAALRAGDVLTPHDGEFARLFPDIDLADGKLSAARAASERAGCIMVLKGADSVIAAPDGRAAINVNAPPDLATAGAGDVLAGFIAGLVAQGTPAFEAAAAGVWFHGACGQMAGPGLTAQDLPKAVPAVLRAMFAPAAQGRAQPKEEAPEGDV